MRRTIFFFVCAFSFRRGQKQDRSIIDNFATLCRQLRANDAVVPSAARKFLLQVDHYAVLGSDYLLNVNVPPPSCPATGSDPCN